MPPGPTAPLYRLRSSEARWALHQTVPTGATATHSCLHAKPNGASAQVRLSVCLCLQCLLLSWFLTLRSTGQVRRAGLAGQLHVRRSSHGSPPAGKYRARSMYSRAMSFQGSSSLSRVNPSNLAASRHCPCVASRSTDGAGLRFSVILCASSWRQSLDLFQRSSSLMAPSEAKIFAKL